MTRPDTSSALPPANREAAPPESPVLESGLPRPAYLGDRNVFLFFLVLVAAFRLASFFESSIDWDESLYLIVADKWLQGHAPYTVVWDNKPPGIYALFAITLKIFGHSILAVRALACVAVAGTCTIVFRVGALLRRDGWIVGLVAGCFYAALSLNNDGMAANTEVFFAAPSAAALYLVLSVARSSLARGATLRLFGAGLLLGLAFEIKYVVVFDIAVAVLALALVFPWRTPTAAAIRAYALGIGALAIGSLLPFIAVTLLFQATGHLAEYWTANVTANQVRTVHQHFQIGVMAAAVGLQIRHGALFWIAPPLALGVLVARGKLESPEDRWFARTVGLSLLAYLGCLLVVFRSFVYDHYFLQLAPWLALLAAFTAVRLTVSRGTGTIAATRPGRLGVLVVVAATLVAQQALPSVLLGAKQIYFRGVKGRRYWLDRPAAVVAYLKPRLGPDDAIYVVDDQPVIYFLTGARLPTPLVFPPFLVRRKDLPDIVGVSPPTELGRIMDSRPAYVLKLQKDDDPYYVPEDQLFFKQLRARLVRDYVLERSIDGLDIFRARNPF